jgi:DNA-binding NarL/FixJ family response regulator
MNQRIKIFIVEYDCVSLITLMLWLDQFPEFDVLGTTINTGNLREQIAELEPDVVLLDIETPGPEDVPVLKEVKSVQPSPAVILLYHGDPDGLEGVLEAESEGQLGPERTLGDLQEAVIKAYNRRLIARSAALAPMAKAG